MLELIDNIFALFSGRVFQNTVGIPMYQVCSSSCRLVPLFAQVKHHTGASQEKEKEASPIL